MDVPHGTAAAHGLAAGGAGLAAGDAAPADDAAPRDDDERFILGLVLTYYRRHPQRARTRLLDLLGEVLAPTPAPLPPQPAPPAPARALAPGVRRPPPPVPLAPQAEDAHALWLRSQSGVAPLKRKK
jgi:hypothetical protein